MFLPINIYTVKKGYFNLLYFAIFAVIAPANYNIFGKDTIEFNEINTLNNENVEYYYSSTISVGGAFNATRGLFSKIDNTDNKLEMIDSPSCDLSGLKNKIILPLGINFSFNFLFSTPFFAKRLGIFPRFGMNLNLIGQNILTRFMLYFFPNVGIMFYNGTLSVIDFVGRNIHKVCCCCIRNSYGLSSQTSKKKYKKAFLSKPSGILNIPFTFEPETNIHETFKAIPQIGFGPAIVFLERNSIAEFFPADQDNFEKNNDDLLYKYLIDMVFSFKMIFKITPTKNHKNSLHLELGYTYNPLILARLSNKENSIVEGGLWSTSLSISYARNMNIGLETVDFLNPQLETTLYQDKSKNKKESKTTFFIDAGIGLGKWVNIATNNAITDTYSPNINLSLSFPYIGVKLSNYHRLSFVGLDITEDILTGPYHNREHNIIWKVFNNLSVNYNFITLTSDYKGVKFVHKLGVYVPFLTNLMSFLEHPAKGRAFTRSMIALEDEGNFLNDDKFSKIFYSRLSYKFRFYFDFLRFLNVDQNLNSHFYIGLNTVLFNRRLDYPCNESVMTDFEFIKVESITIGISFKIN